MLFCQSFTIYRNNCITSAWIIRRHFYFCMHLIKVFILFLRLFIVRLFLFFRTFTRNEPCNSFHFTSLRQWEYFVLIFLLDLILETQGKKERKKNFELIFCNFHRRTCTTRVIFLSLWKIRRIFNEFRFSCWFNLSYKVRGAEILSNRTIFEVLKTIKRGRRLGDIQLNECKIID